MTWLAPPLSVCYRYHQVWSKWKMRMQVTQASARLTDAALMAMLAAAVEKASAMGQPQCIVIVDASAVDLAVLRMTGAKVLSLRSARAKAQTAASTGKPSAALAGGGAGGHRGGDGRGDDRPAGRIADLARGVLLGGIGIGSGSGAQDVEVARAALGAIGAEAV
jgi:glc operon protein GlcG